MTGGTGRDLLIGGNGVATLRAGSGEDIVIAGTAAGISTHLPGVRPDGLNLVRSLSASAGPVTVWERDG